MLIIICSIFFKVVLNFFFGDGLMGCAHCFCRNRFCNLIHEFDIDRVAADSQQRQSNVSGVADDYDINYLRSGTYRDAWRFRRLQSETTIADSGNPNYDFMRDDYVLKRLMYKKSFDQKDLAKIRMEAVVFQQLSANPLILRLYGHCAGSVAVETMASDIDTKIIHGEGIADQKELDKRVNPSLSNYTNSEKLVIALEMAESLASMHGNPNGMIIHADTHIEQWLVDFRGVTRLNDFNNARIRLWKDTSVGKNSSGKYCLSGGTYGDGVVSTQVA